MSAAIPEAIASRLADAVEECLATAMEAIFDDAPDTPDDDGAIDALRSSLLASIGLAPVRGDIR